MNTPPTSQDNHGFDDGNMQKRLKSMFSDQEPPAFASIREVKAMQERIRELEAQLEQTRADEIQSSATKARATDPSLTHPFVENLMPADQTKQVTGYLFRAALFILGAALVSLPL